MTRALRVAIIATAILAGGTALSLIGQMLADAWRVSPLATAYMALALPAAALVIWLSIRGDYRRRQARRAAMFSRLSE